MRTIRIAKRVDLRFVRDLAKRFSNQIGFVPGAGLEFYVESGWVQLTLENGEPAGYLLGRPSLRYDRRIRPITQAAVCLDAQRRHHGLALVDRLVTTAVVAGQTMLQCWCRHDLDANSFWPAAGFVLVATRDAGNARQRPLLLWRRPLILPTPAYIWDLPPVAGYRAATAVRMTAVARHP